YALAVSYCQLRSGRLPFEGDSSQILTGHLMLPPELGMLPHAEQPVVARALAKEPQRRWPSCRALVDALTAAQAGPGQLPSILSPLPAPALPLSGRALAERADETTRASAPGVSERPWAPAPLGQSRPTLKARARLRGGRGWLLAGAGLAMAGVLALVAI